MAGGTQTFKAVVGKAPGGALLIPVPFDPDAIWGKKPRHHVRGNVGPCGWRGTVDRKDDGFALKLGPAWARDNPIAPGTTVDVSLAAEGPQRDALDPDVAAALAEEPKAAAFFDGLAQFYRKAYLKWIDGTKTRPDERKRRIAELVKLLKAGVKQRPGT
jgi:hypothetical protein